MAAKVARPPAKPRVFWSAKKPFSVGDAEDAIFLATVYGMAPDDWQAPIVKSWLARKRDGKFCHGRCGLAVPRQNGKNGVIEVRELFGMIVLGEAFLHTAHEVKTARKAFKRLQHFFGKKANDEAARFPDLNALVKEVRSTNGQEAIVLYHFCENCKSACPDEKCDCESPRVRPGGQVEFVARSSGSGRGFTVDVLILDEAQHLDDDELEAIRSSVSSAPLGNPQVIYTGTPPNRDKGQTGVVWLRVRSSAGKNPRLSWIEYGAPDGPLPDITDLGLLYDCNPALDLRHANGAYGLQMDTIYDELEDLSDEGKARERFGWWGNPEQAGDLIDMTEWANLVDRSAPQPTRASLVVDVEADLSATTIGIAGDGPDGRVLLLVKKIRGTAGAVAAIKELRAKRDIVEVALDESGKAGLLVPALKKAGIEFYSLTSRDKGAACSGFMAGVPDPLNPGGKALWVHVGQVELDASIKNARTRMQGEAEVWDGRDKRIPIGAIRAASYAGHRWRSAAPPKKPPPAPRRPGARKPAPAAGRSRRASTMQSAGF